MTSSQSVKLDDVSFGQPGSAPTVVMSRAHRIVWSRSTLKAD